MSKTLITQYYNRVDKLIQFGGSRKETSVRNEFYGLLNTYADKKNLLLVAELPVRGTKGRDVTPDGTLKNVLRLDYGYWESKDEALDLDEEIEKKIRKGYPLNNILFEDSQKAVLFQGNQEVMRVNMRKPDELDRILKEFINFRNPLVAKFEEAIQHFQADIPIILETLRLKIDKAGTLNKMFIQAADTFLALCRTEINPDISMTDIREMMIQHILTSDIFNKIFDDPEFHRHNNIARELEGLIATLFDHSERRNLLGGIEHYYDAINSAAASVADHHEKQKFLKAIYQNIYKAYNPKAADRLGVVYTPNEIVDFMVDSVNHLLEVHFNRQLWDKNVEILDPATGTGTYICSIIDKCPNQYLVQKYKNELHANEVAILPYYIANLNIEFTFKQKMGYYEEFKNLCFVDTLDNTDALSYSGRQHNLFGLSSENSERIQKQNLKKISVVIANPPYNANQKNENENNKNREYPTIDQRIKETYIKHSTAQKTKVYDMYARFFRWASDRVDENGIIAFITNRSFIESRTFDGFRKCIEDEFTHCYIVDTKSDVRANPKIAGTTHNVFGIQTGVAVMFLVKTSKNKAPCKIDYTSMPDEWRKEEKLNWFRDNPIQNIAFDKILPDKTHNWINLSEENDWEKLLPVADKEVKLGKNKNALFELFSLGVVTARDEWVYDNNEECLKKKVQHLIGVYNIDRERLKGKDKNTIKDEVDYSIKWSRAVKNDLFKDKKYFFNESLILKSLYRPYVKRLIYFSRELNEMQYQLPNLFRNGNNLCIAMSGTSTSKPFTTLVTDTRFCYDLIEKTQCLPFYRYDSSGNRHENLTDWGLQQFVNHYNDAAITKGDIFNYVYAVLHNPAYRKKYEINLKREFPRIPFYNDFGKWAAWGKQLINLHLNYETVAPFPLEVFTAGTKAEAKRQLKAFMAEEPEEEYIRQPKIKAKLKADKYAGLIEIDELTTMRGIPHEAWEYKLGNRSAIEWILDQYKEKKPTDPTIAEKFNTYRFADYKNQVIELIKRVCTVSVETVKVVKEMEKAD